MVTALGAVDTALQAHPFGAVTSNVPLPPLLENDLVTLDSVYVQLFAASCVTVKVCVAEACAEMRKVPVRPAPAFAATF